ncbi:hypothetical protein QE152_g26374 [Popillia japonica]|uniref:Uncharacterized protein n=1 Tax=Popillia japonica TaxID=7064 RepID=A0AAW1JXE3_POPJA
MYSYKTPETKAGTGPTSLGRFMPVFTTEMEQQLVYYCKQLDKLFHGLTIKSLREIVFEFAERNGIEHRFNKISKLAGNDSAYALCRRHNFSVHIAEKTGLARTSGFNIVQVQRFFNNLKRLDTKEIAQHRVYYTDKSGVLLKQNFKSNCLKG